ncbi:sulfotransferase [uncultured Ruegeria sp.]|uniref:sulfotransferase n=1 Tax=uncultured Ruegeria sp. TaxID=259304 RepID=UPI00260E6589|nr:sulfotransferase [uncultured Ruegeria sp.]
MTVEVLHSAQSDPKIILIGLNRCATTSFHKLFQNSGIQSLHWVDGDGSNIAHRMVTNIAMGRKPLDGFGQARAFTDIAFVNVRFMLDGARFFRDLHRAYPDAYFILNTRNRDDWVSSRALHSGGAYLEKCCNANGLTAEEVKQGWAHMYDVHHAEVEVHFDGNPRFLRFDIDTDEPQIIADLLAPDFDVNTVHWGHYNRGASAHAQTG